MAFDIMRLFEDDKYVSPGSIGGKIKKYRELRGWSQKELGLRCGFSASTADVRIAQYEKSKKIPRKKALKDIAAALEIDESALFDAGNYSATTVLSHAAQAVESQQALQESQHSVQADSSAASAFLQQLLQAQEEAAQRIAANAIAINTFFITKNN